MFTKIACKLALKTKSKHKDFQFSNDATDKLKPIILKILDTKELFKQNRDLIISLVHYYTRHKCFTTVQLKAVEGLLNG